MNVFQTYSFHYFPENFDIEQYQDILSLYKESDEIIIIYYEQTNTNEKYNYFFIGFKKTIIFVEQSSISKFFNIFISKHDLTICFFPNTKSIFDQNIQIQYKESPYTLVFQDEIDSFKQNLLILQNQSNLFDKVWKNTQNCIIGYLIKQSYFKLNKNRITSFILNTDQITSEIVFEKNEFIKLRNIGRGSIFYVELLYHIEREELYAVKVPHLMNDELPKLLKRENENHNKVKHPFVPEFIGKIKDENYPIIEFINGNTLEKIKNFKFNDIEKFTLIYEIMIIIYFFHQNHFIYRDLKPDNIMVDENKTIVLIDFDRMINFDEIKSTTNFTVDFSSNFIAPEIFSSNFSYECDVYSLGKVIYFIMNEEVPDNKNSSKLGKLNDFNHLKAIYENCINENPKERFSISELMINFCLNYHQLIKIENLFEGYIDLLFKFQKEKTPIKCPNVFRNLNIATEFISFAIDQNKPNMQFMYGKYYEEGKYVKKDMKKAIQYFTSAADNNNKQAQYKLGMIYLNGDDIQQDTVKAIHYLTLAAEKNHKDAQFELGKIYLLNIHAKRDVNKAIKYLTPVAKDDANAQYILASIYFEGKYDKQDYKKAIHYFTLAAEKNIVNAQYALGHIYSNFKYVDTDINKAIYYYQLAANKNHSESQFWLGMLYYFKVYPIDINKSIKYLMQAAKQNHPNALHNLGVIYSQSPFVKKDIEKAINLFQSAANLNVPDSQYNLGVIYYEGEYVARDINKSINYLSLAAKNNFLEAQLYLGHIYYKDYYMPRDINKSIYYFELAAKSNNSEAQYNLAMIYDKSDFDKSFYYLNLAADQNLPPAQYRLGFMYYNGFKVQKNINKAISYFEKAAKSNFSLAQVMLGVFYYENYNDLKTAEYYFDLASNQKDPFGHIMLSLIYLNDSNIGSKINKVIHLLKQTTKTKYKFSNFILGFIYHAGYYVNKDIKSAIHFYKESSSFNIPFAKNNLAIIYKNGINDEIEKNILYCIELLNEAIVKSNDVLSMYNLARIYLFDDAIKKNEEKAVELLIKSANQNFYHSQELLILFIIKKYRFNIEDIIKEIPKFGYNLKRKTHLLRLIICKVNEDISLFENKYEFHSNNDLIYDYFGRIISYDEIMKKKYDIQSNNKKKNITHYFYEGFGF